MGDQVQLNHILLDVDFFDKPKVKALAFKCEQLSVLLLIKIYASMSRATNALVTRDTIEALAWEMRFDAERVEPFLDYAVSESLIFRQGDLFTSGRVKEDQQKLALARKKAKDRQNKSRKSQEQNDLVTRDNSVTDENKTCDLDPVTVTEDVIELDLKKKSKTELKIPEWVEREPDVLEAVEYWIKYRKEKKSKLTQSTLDAQLKRYNEGEYLKAAISQSVEKGWIGLFDPDKPKKSAVPKSIVEYRNKIEALDNQ